MMKTGKKHVLIFIVLLLLLAGCSRRVYVPLFETGIEREPIPQNLGSFLEPLHELPHYNSAVQSRPDLRSRDLTKLDMSGKLDTLLHSSFNTKTKWPADLPAGFDPEGILEVNKNPGLNLRFLHEQGITGQGISVAVIDYTLPVRHHEYNNSIKMYREINCDRMPAEFHGASMLSILAGRSTGVAPGVSVYYVAVRNMDFKRNDVIQNQEYTAEAIYGLLKLNEKLPEHEKIRVISLSQWWSPHTKGYKSMKAAVKEAKQAGVFVVSCNLWQFNEKFHIHGLLKPALADPDSLESYFPAPWDHWVAAVNRNGHGDFYVREQQKIADAQVLLIPSGYTTSAGAEDDYDYIFTPQVNWSNTIPYVSGLYALACQVKPDITPEMFWETAYRTGRVKTAHRAGMQVDARIVNPVSLIESLKNNEGVNP